MYNEIFANSILAKLDELFPTPTSAEDLKEFQVGGFEKEPKKAWLDAVDALLKHGLADGKPLYEGEALADAANLIITREGREAVRRTGAQQTPPDSKSKLVFLSHAAKDQDIAIFLKRVVENAIPDSDVFVSSDTEDLHPGDEWVRKIQEKLREAKMLLILATDRSLNRPWVWFEAGAGWRGDLRMIPCCLGTVRKNRLSAPFSSYQALNADEEIDLRALLTEVSGQLQLPLHPAAIPSIIAELQRLDRVAHDSVVSVLTPEEIQRRVDTVNVAAEIQYGYPDNFTLLLENESEETVHVREICFLSEKEIRLTEPHHLGPKESSKLNPKEKLKLAWAMNINPANTLMDLYPNGTVDWHLNDAVNRFGANIAIDVTCEVLGKLKHCRSKLHVQVDVRNHRITQIAG